MFARTMVLLVGAVLLVTDISLCAEFNGGVHSGEKITALTPGKIEIKVRLEGIDASELKQAFGKASKQELSTMSFCKNVRRNDKGKDRFGWSLADVYADPIWVNEAQVRVGMAWIYLKYSKDQGLAPLEWHAWEKPSELSPQ